MTASKLLLLIFLARNFFLPGFCLEDAEEKETLKRWMPTYTMISTTDLLNSTRCRKELEEYRQAFDQRRVWSLKVFDSSGIPGSSFLYGNNFWVGSRSQCEDAGNRSPMQLNANTLANNSKYRNPNDEYPPFEFNYFVAHFEHNSTAQYHIGIQNENIMTFGTCLPTSCTTHEVTVLLENVFKNRTLVFGDIYSMDFRLLEVRDLKNKSNWLLTGGNIIVMLTIVVTILLLIAGTVYDVLRLKRIKKRKMLLSCENNNRTIQLTTKESPDDPENQDLTPKLPSLPGRMLLAFSVYSNTKHLFHVKPSSNTIPAINGLRFFGMMWIIMVHTLYYASDTIENKVSSWRRSEGFLAQVITNSTLSVDTYFFMSGFLLAQVYLINKRSKEERKFSCFIKMSEFLMGLWKRFIRITPAYMVALGIHQINATWYSKTSIFLMNERPQEICPKYWWRNMLYIQNLFNREEMCMSWSWYLADDMQCFMIGFALLSLASAHTGVVISLLTIMLIGSVTITGYISYDINYIPTLDQQYLALHQLYDPFWTRIGPYIVGMITAYINIKLDKKLRVKKRTLVILWILGSSCNLLVLFGLGNRQISLLASTFYSALSRTVWAIGIGWLVIACITNHAGLINKFLSYKIWVPLSRLSYSAYLLNPIIITSINLHNENPVYLDYLNSVALFIANTVLSYLSAYFFMLMFETPYILLLKEKASPSRKS